MKKNDILNKLLAQKPVLKVIAGIENFESEAVKNVALAANGQAIAIDISADQELITWVKANTNLLVFVSSLEPEILAQAAVWGADLLELGNFDPIYKRGLTVTSQQVLEWTRSLQQLTQGQTALCITVPGKQPIAEQVDLARQLQAAGADLLQIENVREDMTHASEIRKVVELPLILSAKLDSNNLSEALSTGVDGLGIGAAIRVAGSVENMRKKIASLQAQMSHALIR